MAERILTDQWQPPDPDRLRIDWPQWFEGVLVALLSQICAGVVAYLMTRLVPTGWVVLDARRMVAVWAAWGATETVLMATLWWAEVRLAAEGRVDKGRGLFAGWAVTTFVSAVVFSSIAMSGSLGEMP